MPCRALLPRQTMICPTEPHRRRYQDRPRAWFAATVGQASNVDPVALPGFVAPPPGDPEPGVGHGVIDSPVSLSVSRAIACGLGGFGMVGFWGLPGLGTGVGPLAFCFLNLPDDICAGVVGSAYPRRTRGLAPRYFGGGLARGSFLCRLRSL